MKTSLFAVTLALACLSMVDAISIQTEQDMDAILMAQTSAANIKKKTKSSLATANDKKTSSDGSKKSSKTFGPGHIEDMTAKEMEKCMTDTQEVKDKFDFKKDGYLKTVD